MWDRVLPLLPEDVEVILWEQPGHGNSGLLGDVDGGVPAIARALNDALEEVGVDDFHIAGLSLGGMVSLAHTQEFPGLAKSLGMFSSGAVLLPHQVWVERAEQVSASGTAALADGTMERWFTPDFASGEGAQAVEQTRATLVGTDPSGYAQCCTLIATTDMREDTGKVSVPVLLVVGRGDPGMTPQQAEELAGMLDNAQVTVIEDARHLTAVQHPEKVAAALSELVS